MNKQIIAIGGGGFGRNPNHRLIENYILEQSDEALPNVLFVPTASAENKSYIVNFYSCFSKLKCKPRHINLFERTPRLESLFNKADVIYVGGGNTRQSAGTVYTSYDETGTKFDSGNIKYDVG